MSESQKEPDVEKADALVDEGLKLYSQGLLDQSLSKWRAALEEVPDHPRAKEYIKYVEDNRPALEDSFHLAASDAQTKDEVDSEAGASGVGHPEDDQPKDGKGEDDEGEDDEGEDDEGEDDEQLPSEPMARGGAADPAGQVVLMAEPPPGRSQVPARIEATARMDVEELRARLNATKLRTKAHKLAQRDEDEPKSGDESKGGEEPKDGDEPKDRDTAEEAVEQEEAAAGSNSTSQEVHQRLTPATLSPAVKGTNEGGRDRKATPLVLMAGEGEKEEEGFEPLESTPLGVGMPEPARLVSSSQRTGFAVGEATPVIDPQDGLPAGAMPGGKHPSSTQTALGAPEEGERVESMLAGARQLLEQGTNEGSLWLCERVLSLDPDNEAAKKLLEDNRTVLLTQYQAQIGELEEVPVVQIPQHEIMWHKLDHRAGFLLSRIDGQLTYGDIIDVSGMGDFEATRILAQLQGMGVIGARK